MSNAFVLRNVAVDVDVVDPNIEVKVPTLIMKTLSQYNYFGKLWPQNTQKILEILISKCCSKAGNSCTTLDLQNCSVTCICYILWSCFTRKIVS